MRFWITLALVPLSAAMAQTPQKDADTLRDLLVEVRTLRQAVQGMVASFQHVQIALHKLQWQEAAVSRASQRVDASRSQRQNLEMQVDQMTRNMQLTENMMNQTTSDARRKELQGQIANIKQAVEQQTAYVQKLQADEAQATSELRNEQAKLGEIQSQIDKLDRGPAQ